MCANSEARLKDKEVALYMGYYGGEIYIDNLNYKHNEGSGGCKREEIIAELCKYDKEDIVKMIVDLVDNAEED